MSEAFLGVGSNVQPERHIKIAISALQDRFTSVELSPVYRSQAVGFDGEDFINLVARVETSLTPEQLHKWLHALEDQHGRKRDVPKFSDRVLDIDILLYDRLVLNQPGLVLPRPEILQFAHVLRPLAELAPELQLPGTQKTLRELWNRSGLEKTPLELLGIRLFT